MKAMDATIAKAEFFSQEDNEFKKKMNVRQLVRLLDTEKQKTVWHQLADEEMTLEDIKSVLQDKTITEDEILRWIPQYAELYHNKESDLIQSKQIHLRMKNFITWKEWYTNGFNGPFYDDNNAWLLIDGVDIIEIFERAGLEPPEDQTFYDISVVGEGGILLTPRKK